jgi:hypothetical protein
MVKAPDHSETKPDQQGWKDEGGHMSSTAGRVMQVVGAELPFVAVLAHHGSDSTEHGFATMREAEAFIKRNTPVPSRTLSRLYDRPATD